MATKFQIKRSSVSGRTPNTTNSANSSYIAAGELALNLTDKKMYSSNGTNYFEIGSFKVEQTNSTSNVSTFTEISTLQFDQDSGFAVTSPSTGVAKIAINSTFKFWQVDGVQKLTAAGLDTVNFIGGNNISITANGANTPQSIAFATSMTPTFTSVTFGNSTVNTTINSSSIAVTKIFANGVTGSAGQVLSANSTGGIYWETSAGGAGTLTVTSDTFNGNGSNTIFTLSTSSTTDRSFVYLNGVQQAPTTDYTISGTTLTFVAAPASNNVIEVRSFDIPSIADITITSDTFTANGTQTNFTLSTPDSSVTNSLVFLNGVTQVPTTDYTLSSTTLTFLSAPVNGTAVQAISFTSAGVKSAAFTGNGSNTQFTLPVISTTSKTIVAINGVTQTPVTDYSVSGTTLIFAVAPVNNDNILVRVLPSKVDSAGGNTQIQYNKSGSLGGSAGFTFNDTTNNVVVGNTLTVPNFILNASNPPANSTSTGTTGTFAWDSSFFYVATGTNTWKKVPITTDGAGGGSGTPGGSNTHIQYNDSNTFNGSAAFTFNESTNTVALSNTLAIGSNVTVNTSTIFIGNSSVNTTITAGNVHLQGTQLTVGNVVLTGEQLTVGNSTVNSVIRANGVTFTGDLMPSANVTYDIGNSAMRWRDLWLSGTTINLGGATIKTDTDTGAIAFVPKATADVPNPKAVVVSPRGGIKAVDTTDGVPVINNSITAVDGISYGNSTVNTSVNSTSVSTITLNVGSNVFVNTSTIHLGNSTVNTVIHTTGFTGNGAGLHGVNAAALEGNTVANILTAANTAANTLANAAYSNAVSYAASNTYVNNTFLPLAGGTLTGAITVGNSTVNSVVNSTSASLGNTTITGFVNVSSNLTVTSVAAFGNNVTITGNLIVTGTRIFANTTTVDLSDNIITLNADIGQVTPSENAGLEVHRGTSANVQFVWNETIDKWTFTTDGTNYVTVASNNDVTTAYSNAIAYSGNAALAYANAIAYAASNTYVNSTFAPLSGATFTGAVSGITTLAAGNTTITGLINVSTNTATFGTALYVVANGNVGIGTSSPGVKLDVFAGDISIRASTGTDTRDNRFLRIFRGSLGADQAGVIFGTGPSTENWFIGHPYSSGGVFNALVISEKPQINDGNGILQKTPIMYFTTGAGTAAGNVGIGTTSPTAALHVSGTSGDAAPTFRINGTAAASTFNWAGSIMNSSLGSSRNTILLIGQAESNRNCGYIGFNHSGTSGSNTNFLTFGLHSVDNVLNITGAGNVGIGTTSPADTNNFGRALDIRSSTGAAAYFRDSDDATKYSVAGFFGADSLAYYGSWGAGTGVLFYSAGSERMRLDSSGNLGIGTTTPRGDLDVGTATASAITKSIHLGYSAADFYGFRLTNINTAASFGAGTFSIQRGSTAAWTSDFIMDNTGKVSIAEGNAPTQVLSIYRGGSTQTVMSAGNSTTGLNGSYFGVDTAGNAIINQTQALAMIFSTSGTERARITSGGNFGIGTTSPVTKLHVNAEVSDDNNYAYDTNSLYVVHQTPTSTTTLNDPQEVMLLARQGTGGQAYGAAASFRLSRYENSSVNSRTRMDIVLAHNSFFTTPTTVMTIRSDGNVGIGNTAPTDKLSVNGNVYVSGTLTEASSIALKENIDPITGALSIILGINGYTYDRKDGSRRNEPGLIAEEVAEVLPNIIQRDDQGNPSGVQYTKIIAYLVESIKELKAEIDILKGR